MIRSLLHIWNPNIVFNSFVCFVLSSIFKEKEISECLYDIHDKFVVCPVDKASKNFAVVCKSFYKSLILN